MELKTEDRNLLQSTIEAIKGASKDEPEVKPSASGHETLEEIVDCPDCYPKIRSLVLQKHAKETKDSGIVCEECGIGVKKEWEKCPNCGSKDAREK